MRTNSKLFSFSLHSLLGLAFVLVFGMTSVYADNQDSERAPSGSGLASPADTENKKAENPGEANHNSSRMEATNAESNSSPVEEQSKAAARADERYMSIPLLYMTDRKINQLTQFGNDRKNQSNSIHDVYCGNINYTLSNFQKKHLTGNRKALGWKSRAKSSRMTHKLMGSPEQPSDVLDSFGEAVVEFARKTGQKEVFVFVHGFNCTFESSARCAALLAYHTERPVILYSWPSRAKLFQYLVDSCNNEWSQEHFNRLVEMLYGLKEKYGINVNVVAHSMGNRLVVRAAPILENKRLFSQVFLVDPDLDSETFLHYVARYEHKQEMNVGDRMRILFSHKDNVLPVAQMLFGGYARLGQGADTIVESIFKPYQVMPAVLRSTKTALGYGKMSSSGSHKDVAHNLFRKELDWIDFTVLDHGVIGHSIPYELIANLSQTARPGSGLAFESVEVGVSDLKDKVLTHYLGNKKQCNPLGVCRRVVFTDEVAPPTVPPLARNDSKIPESH